MAGAVNGHVRVPTNPYPEFVNPESMPAGEHELFVAAFAALLAKRAEPLSREEYQLAWLVGREMWRECYYACAEARRAEVLREMEERTETDLTRRKQSIPTYS